MLLLKPASSGDISGESELVDKSGELRPNVGASKQQMQRIIIIQQPSGGQSLLISGASGAQPVKGGPARTIIVPSSLAANIGSTTASSTLTSLVSAAGSKPRVVIRGQQNTKRNAHSDVPLVINELEDETVAAEVEVDDDGVDGKSKRKRGRKPRVTSKQPSMKKSKKLAALAQGRRKGRHNRDSDATDEDENVSRAQSPGSGQDESLMLELLETRRSSRQVKRKRYFDDVDLNLSDDDKKTDTEETEVDVCNSDALSAAQSGAQFFLDNPSEEEANVVDKILGMRVVKRPKLKIERTSESENIDILNSEAYRDGLKTPPATGGKVLEGTHCATSPEKREGFWRSRLMSHGDDFIEMEEVEEFFVKYKNFSYLHCEWKTANDLERGDKRIHMKIRRFKIKQMQQPFMAQLDEDELFNQEYTEIERLLEVSVAPDPKTGQDVTYYLVKWRSLPYEDSTWEVIEDVTDDKIEEFERYNSFPPEEEQEVIIV